MAPEIAKETVVFGRYYSPKQCPPSSKHRSEKLTCSTYCYMRKTLFCIDSRLRFYCFSLIWCDGRVTTSVTNTFGIVQPRTHGKKAFSDLKSSVKLQNNFRAEFLASNSNSTFFPANISKANEKAYDPAHQPLTGLTVTDFWQAIVFHF